MHCQALLWCTFPFLLRESRVPIRGIKSITLPAADLFKTRESWSVQNSNTFFTVTSSSQSVPRGERGWVYFRSGKEWGCDARSLTGEYSRGQKNIACMETRGRKHVKATLYKQGVAVIVLVGWVCPMRQEPSWSLSSCCRSAWPFYDHVL